MGFPSNCKVFTNISKQTREKRETEPKDNQMKQGEGGSSRFLIPSIAEERVSQLLVGMLAGSVGSVGGFVEESVGVEEEGEEDRLLSWKYFVKSSPKIEKSRWSWKRELRRCMLLSISFVSSSDGSSVAC